MYRILLQSCRRANHLQLRRVSSITPGYLHAKSLSVDTRKSLHLFELRNPYFVPYRNFGDKKERDEKGEKDDKTDEQKKAMEERLKAIAMIVTITSLYFFMVSPSMEHVEPAIVSWNEFYHNMLAKGEVEEVIVKSKHVEIVVSDGAIIKGQMPLRHRYVMLINDVPDFERRLRIAEEELGVMPGSVPVVYDNSNLLPLAFLAGIVWLLIILAKKGTSGKGPTMDIFGGIRKARFTVVDNAVESSKPKVRFTDVAGCHGAKQEVAEFIDYLQDATKYQKLGAKVPRGVLLLGPPGCGKTMLAKAVAAEAQVPFLAMAGSEFIEMIGGLGAARVRNLFQEARKRSPCIIYIDEIDAIGRKRSDLQENPEADQTINQLLTEMDGMTSKSDIVMLASTNRPDILDKALLRPGRFDRHILIDLPNQAERVEIYDKHLSDIALDKSPSSYSPRLASLTPGFSGADIANVCNEAALHAARTKKRVVTGDDIEYAVERVLAGTEKTNHAMSLEERQRVAVHEAGRAIVSWYSAKTDNLLKISIVPRNKGTLSMARFEPSEQKLQSTEDLIERICVALGGRAAESVVYGKAAAGFEGDLKRVTEIAKAMVETFGMDDTIGPLSFDDRKPYSKRLANTMDQREQQLVMKAYAKATKLIKAHREKLKELTDALLAKEVMHFKDVEAILGPRATREP